MEPTPSKTTGHQESDQQAAAWSTPVLQHRYYIRFLSFLILFSLLHQAQHVVGQLVGLGEHGGASLLQNL